MDSVPGMLDIRAFKVAHLTNTEPGREHQAEEGFPFQIIDRSKKGLHFLPRRDKRNIRVKSAEGKLVAVPRFMKDIESEKAQLGDAGIDSTVRESAGLLDPCNKLPEILPGSIFGQDPGDIFQILKICRDISGIRSNGVVSKTTQGEHLPELF